MNGKYIILSDERYVIYQYSNGMYGASIKIEGEILQLNRQYHSVKDAKQASGRTINERGMAKVLESENVEQMALF